MSDGGSCNCCTACCTAVVAGPSATPLREIEADGDRRELALVADRQRRDRVGRPFGESAQGDHLPSGRRTDIELVERGGIAPQGRQHLLDHPVGVHLGEILRHFALAERVVERVVDKLRLDAEPRGHVAVDFQRERRARVLLIGRDVAQFRQRLELVQNLRAPRR